MAGGAERIPERAYQERADGVGIAEPELGLGGMDVHVDLLRRHRQEETEHGIAAVWHEVAIGGAHGARKQLVAHRTAIDDEVELETVRPMQRREPGEALNFHPAAGGADGQRILDEILAKDPAEARQRMIDQPGRAGLETQRGALTVGEAKGDLWLGKRQTLHDVGDRGRLDALGLHEFQPRRRCVEEIAHLDSRTGGKSGRLDA